MATATETWLYAGQRLGKDDKPRHAWHDGHDLLYYKKLSAFSVGGAYRVDVDRASDGLSVSGSPRYIDANQDGHREPTPTQLEPWRAEDAAAKAIVEGKRLEKAAAGDGDLEKALEVIRRHYDRLRTMQKRGAFISYITGEMTRPPTPDADSDEED